MSYKITNPILFTSSKWETIIDYNNILQGKSLIKFIFKAEIETEMIEYIVIFHIKYSITTVFSLIFEDNVDIRNA